MEKDRESQQIIFKAKATLPNEFDLKYREERAEEAQKMAYLKYHAHRDRMLTSDGRIKILTHISGKAFFLNTEGKIGFIRLRDDLEILINFDSVYQACITVTKMIIISGSKVLSVTDYENQTEMDEVNFRTYTVEGATFVDLMENISRVVHKIWDILNGMDTPELKEKNRNIRMDSEGEPIPLSYTINPDDPADILEKKTSIRRSMTEVYSKYRSLLAGSVQKKVDVAASGEKPATK